MTQNAVAVEHLSHAYDDHQALSDVSLAIDAREIFGFLGPNGSGKTTLFRILTTLLPPQSGEVRLLGMDVRAQLEQIRQNIAVVFQSPSLDKQLSAEENLRHHGHLYGLRGRELGRRIGAMLDRFNLAGRRSERVEHFSGGMRRRVELAKALLTRPLILLMDEPSTGLDPAARIELWQALHETRARDGVTILLTTHLMDEAERCERLAILDRGRLVACGAPGTLKHKIGGEVITLSSDDPPALQRLLRERLDVSAERINGTLRIERAGAHDFIPHLFSAAPGLIESISVHRPTLEDVFVRATGHQFEREH